MMMMIMMIITHQIIAFTAGPFKHLKGGQQLPSLLISIIATLAMIITIVIIIAMIIIIKIIIIIAIVIIISLFRNLLSTTTYLKPLQLGRMIALLKREVIRINIPDIQ